MADQKIGSYYIDAEKIEITYVYTGFREQGYYYFLAEGFECRDEGQPFFELDKHWVGKLKFDLKAGGIPLPPVDKSYKVEQIVKHIEYQESIIIRTFNGITKVKVQTIPQEEAPGNITELFNKTKPDTPAKANLPAPIIGKGVSFNLKFEEAYNKALEDLLETARTGGYIPPYNPIEFEIYRQNLTPLIGTFPPHYALEVFLIAPWPQKK